MLNFITPLRAVVGGIAIAGGLLIWHLWGELDQANQTIGEQKTEIRGLQADLISAAENARKQQQTITDLQDVSENRAADAAELSNRVGTLQSKLTQLARDADKPKPGDNTGVQTDETTCNFYRNSIPTDFLNLMRDAARAANGDAARASTNAARSGLVSPVADPAAGQTDERRAVGPVYSQ